MPDADGHDGAFERALDDLYAVEPSEFVARRTELAKELRAIGAKNEARALAKARRPSNAAWALNAVARSHPELIAAVIEAGRSLARQVRSGDAEKVRTAMRERRSAVNAAASAAVGAARRVTPNAEGLGAALAASLEAASVDEDTAAELEAGRLAHEPRATVGFPEVAGLKLVPRPAPEVTPAGRHGSPTVARESEPAADGSSAPSARRAPDAGAAKRAAALAELDELRRAATEAEELVETSARETDRARARRDRARAGVKKAEHELGQAERDLRAASAELGRRETAARRAGEVVARRERRLP